MEIRDYSIGDEHKIIELFELVFKQKMKLDSWYWRFRDNPAGSFMIKLMWENDILIGHYAVSPIFMKINGQKVLTAHSLATMTHPDFAGKGIFKALSNSLYQEVEGKYNCKAIWGYPNTNSHYAFINGLGWKNIAVIHTLGLYISATTKPEKLIVLREFIYFSENEINYIERKLASYPVYVERSKEYMDWRFHQKPSVNYRSFTIEQGGVLEGVIISKIYGNAKGNFDLNIVECYLDDYTKLQSIIFEIVAKYGVNIDRVTIWKNLYEKEHLALEKFGFVPVLPYTYFGARVHESVSEIFLDYKSWYIAIGDSDVY